MANAGIIEVAQRVAEWILGLWKAAWVRRQAGRMTRLLDTRSRG
jgi:hypothetical protein